MINRFLLSFLIVISLVVGSIPAFAKPDRDNNPPGPRGGVGTNWENPRGPVGGSGASPDRPGMNPPGVFGGPGAGPLWKDNPNKIDNPPGPMGGAGTDWNPPGPIGGPGGVGPVKDSEKYEEWIEKHKEKAAEWQEKKEALKEKMDLNDDGKIEPKEKALAREKWMENHPEMKEKWEERREKRQEEIEKWHANRPMPPGHMKEQFDADQNGKLNKEERENLKTAWKEKHEAWKKAHPGAGPDRGGPTIQRAMAKHAGGGKPHKKR